MPRMSKHVRQAIADGRWAAMQNPFSDCQRVEAQGFVAGATAAEAEGNYELAAILRSKAREHAIKSDPPRPGGCNPNPYGS